VRATYSLKCSELSQWPGSLWQLRVLPNSTEFDSLSFRRSCRESATFRRISL